MAKEAKVVIMVPAGPRPGTDGRPEYISRQDMRDEISQRDASGKIDFAMELKVPEKFPPGFDPAIFGDMPYAMHASNECLTQLYKAEQEGNQSFIDEFWGRIMTWACWRPAPLYCVFHGAGLGAVPPIDENRFNIMISPEEWLARAKWHIPVFTRMREMGLPVAMETMYLCNYYGPPYFEKNWLPVTYLSPRVGIYDDLEKIVRDAGIESVVDFEHLEGALCSLNGEMIELEEMSGSQFAHNGSNEFRAFFGFEAEQGKICICRRTDCNWPDWSTQVQYLSTPYYHVGSINPQVFDLPEGEADTEYHRALERQLEGNPYAQALVRRRRGGSHDAVRADNERLMEMLEEVLYIQAADKSPVYLCIETSNRGEAKGPDGDPGYWYWAEPDALGTSFTNLIEILKTKL